MFRLIGCASVSKCAARLQPVPAFLELTQIADHAVDCIDGVGARAHLAHMHGDAAHLDLEPEHAGVGAHQHLLLGLGDQAGIGPVAPEVRHQRAVARRFLLDDRLQIDRRRRLQADAAERIERRRHGRMADLHVRPAAAVDPVPFDHRIERRMRPHVGRAVGTTSTWDCRISERPVSSRGRWMATTIGASECSGENFEPPDAARSPPGPWRSAPWRNRAPSRSEHEILDRMLLSPQRREADQLLRMRDLRRESLLDGAEDAGGEVRGEGHGRFRCHLSRDGGSHRGFEFRRRGAANPPLPLCSWRERHD